MKVILAIGICIIVGGAMVWLPTGHKFTQTANAPIVADKHADALNRWLDERGKPRLLEDIATDTSRAKAFLLALDHYRYILRPDATIEEATSYAKSSWNEYLDRPDIGEITNGIKIEKQLRREKNNGGRKYRR
jgi:hypothetical protein